MFQFGSIFIIFYIDFLVVIQKSNKRIDDDFRLRMSKKKIEWLDGFNDKAMNARGRHFIHFSDHVQMHIVVVNDLF